MAKRKFSELGLLIGVFGGAALGYWLNSAEGRKWVGKVGETLSEQGTKIKEQSEVLVGNVQESLNLGLETSVEQVSHGSEKAKEVLAATKDTGERIIDKFAESYERGVRKAQDKLATSS